MGNIVSAVRSKFRGNMCLGAHQKEDIQSAETVESQFDVLEVFEGEGGDSLVDFLHESGDYNDLPYEEGEPDLVWIYGGDEQWHLCAECATCCALMTYPGSPHNCPDGDIFEGPVETIPALFASATSLEVEGRNLLCDESLDLTVSEAEYILASEGGHSGQENTQD